MDELKTIIELLKKIRNSNNSIFNSCPENKLLSDIEYGNLYQAFWASDFRLKNVIGLLEVVETSLSNDKNYKKI